MRVTKRQLKRIIKEEKARLLSEQQTSDLIIVTDRGGVGRAMDAKDRFHVQIDVKSIVSPELYSYLPSRGDWRKMSGGPTALGKTEEEARAKLDRATDKFLTMLDDKIIEAQNDLNMLNEFRAAVEVL